MTTYTSTCEGFDIMAPGTKHALTISPQLRKIIVGWRLEERRQQREQERAEAQLGKSSESAYE